MCLCVCVFVCGCVCVFAAGWRVYEEEEGRGREWTEEKRDRGRDRGDSGGREERREAETLPQFLSPAYSTGWLAFRLAVECPIRLTMVGFATLLAG